MEHWEANMSITDLFGPDREQWAVKKARAFAKAFEVLWETGDE